MCMIVNYELSQKRGDRKSGKLHWTTYDNSQTTII